MRRYCMISLCFVTALFVAAVIPLLSGCGSSARSSCTVSLPGRVPLELVELPYGILFGKYEVTQAQWEAVLGNNPSSNKNPENPVESVSWDDCQIFLKKLNAIPSVQKEGIVFRLPHVSEQIYARYAGSAGPYCRLVDGTDITEKSIGRVAWYDDNSRGETHPVGQREPNAFHLYDIFGNVFEWCQEKENRVSLSWNHDDRIEKYFVAGGGCFSTELVAAGFSSMADSIPHDTCSPKLGLRVCAFRVGQKEAKRRVREQIREENLHAEMMDKEIKALIADMVPIPGKKYYMGKYEVTQLQWEAVLGTKPVAYESEKGADIPVGNVSWYDCQKFLHKLNALADVKKSGRVFRLPCRDEWEYACRAGATGDYCMLADGTEITEDTLGKVAWFKGNDDGKVHPVGEKEPNAFGLYDMHGNMREWTRTSDAAHRITCGGNWGGLARLCEAANHFEAPPDCRYDFLGFRLCASQKQRSQIVKDILESMVTIPEQDYMIGRTEVTQEQWEAVMGDNLSAFDGASNPVENVSWNDCQEFLETFNALPEVKEAGLVFRLPSESEWEYACCSGATGDFCKLADGTEISEYSLMRVAWYEDNSDEKTHPVGQKKPNAFGLYDMLGNVWEWTQTADGAGRVTRGGSWDRSTRDCKSSVGTWDSPDNRRRNQGFRLCAEKR